MYKTEYHLDKLPLALSPEKTFRAGLSAHGIDDQPLCDAEIWHLQKLPDHHRDPFDRMLMAYALCEGLKFASPDPVVQTAFCAEWF